MLTILLLPGMDGTGALFAPFLGALGNAVNVIVVRYPTTEALGYGELTEIARRSLPRHGKFMLLGESFSGPIAVALAAGKPAGLVGLVLCATFIRNPRPALKPFGALLGFAPVKAAPNFLHDFLLLGRRTSPELAAMVAAAVGQLSAQALRTRLRAVLDANFCAELKEVDVPILYLRALQDRLVPSREGAFIKHLRPDIQSVAIAAPHCLLQVAPQEAVAQVMQFARLVTGDALT